MCTHLYMGLALSSAHNRRATPCTVTISSNQRVIWKGWRIETKAWCWGDCKENINKILSGNMALSNMIKFIYKMMKSNG